ncbi:hypothetical protein FRC08_007396 [Ceratobasidium sp. 394]|nr:hypothetical protein FRC08_007396 [Ceratobasidium sp. 394]
MSAADEHLVSSHQPTEGSTDHTVVPVTYSSLTPVQKKWVNENLYDGYLGSKAPRGSRTAYNAKDYTEEVLDKYVDHFHADWSKSKRAQYRTPIFNVIYNYFNNKYASDQAARDQREAAKVLASQKKKVYPENLFARQHSETVHDGMDTHLSEHPEVSKTIGLRRTVVSNTFKGLDIQDRAHWNNVAADKRAQQRAQGLLHGPDRVIFVRDWVNRLSSAITEGHVRAGISFTGFICWEDADQYHIEDLTSNDIKEYATSEEFADSHGRFSRWFRDYKGAPVEGQAPRPAVIPNPSNFYRPKFPELDTKIPARLLRELNRQYGKAEYGFAGGLGSVPWKTIRQAFENGDVHTWIPSWPPNLEFDDPSRLSHPENQQMYQFFRKTQDGDPPEDGLWFAQVIVGTSPPSEGCAGSASRISTMDKNGVKHYIAHFDGPVTQPQSARAVPYGEESWRYYYHIIGGDNLDHWLGLKNAVDRSEVDLIPADAFDFVRSILDPVNKPLSSKVIELFDAINNMERHGPHTTAGGIWDLSGAASPIPNILPSSKPENVSNFVMAALVDFWVDNSYAMSSYLARQKGFAANSTMECAESWLDSLPDSSFIHKPSDTLQGGDGGVMWPGFLIVKLLLNCSVSFLRAKPPSPPPAGLDLQRLGQSTYFKMCEYLDTWLELCRTSIKVLSATSHERVHCAGSDSTLDEEASHDLGDDQIENLVDTPQVNPGPTKSKAGQKRKAPAKEKPRANRTSSVAHLPTNNESEFLLDRAFFEPSTPVSTDFKNREVIFGRFAPQPEVPAHNGTPQDVLGDTHRVLGEIGAAMKAWKKFDESTYVAAYPVPVIEHAAMLSQRAHPGLCSLVQGILQHRFDMNRSRSLWPQVRALSSPIVLGARKLSSLLKAIDNVLENGSDGPVKTQLKKTRQRVRQAIISSRTVFEPLRETQVLATTHANSLQDGWDNDIFAMGINELFELARGLGKWRDETGGLIRDLENIYIAMWREHDCSEGRPSKNRFRFGCPAEPIFGGEAHTLLLKNPPGQRLLTPRPVSIEPNPEDLAIEEGASGSACGDTPSLAAATIPLPAAPDSASAGSSSRELARDAGGQPLAEVAAAPAGDQAGSGSAPTDPTRAPPESPSAGSPDQEVGREASGQPLANVAATPAGDQAASGSAPTDPTGELRRVTRSGQHTGSGPQAEGGTAQAGSGALAADGNAAPGGKRKRKGGALGGIGVGVELGGSNAGQGLVERDDLEASRMQSAAQTSGAGSSGTATNTGRKKRQKRK